MVAKKVVLVVVVARRFSRSRSISALPFSTRALSVRLLPLLVMHVALRVGLDLDEPLDVDVRPVRGDRARRARRAARRFEWRLIHLRLALGNGEPKRLAARRRVVHVALGREHQARRS